MLPQVAVAVARLSRRVLCTAVALAMSLSCALLVVATPTTPVAGMTGIAPMGTTGVLDRADDLATTGPVCVDDMGEVCTVGAGLTMATLLALLLVPRRQTLMELLARPRPWALPRRWRRRAPWRLLSPISLCVLRV